MRPDARLRDHDAALQLADALLSYPGDPRHVTIYILRREHGWNALPTIVADVEGISASRSELSRICQAVEVHLRHELDRPST
jgi:hypothetical protein